MDTHRHIMYTARDWRYILNLFFGGGGGGEGHLSKLSFTIGCTYFKQSVTF